jgi:hypothetical protein
MRKTSLEKRGREREGRDQLVALGIIGETPKRTATFGMYLYSYNNTHTLFHTVSCCYICPQVRGGVGRGQQWASKGGKPGHTVAVSEIVWKWVKENHIVRQQKVIATAHKYLCAVDELLSTQSIHDPLLYLAASEPPTLRFGGNFCI